MNESHDGRFERLELVRYSHETGSGVGNIWVHSEGTCTPPCAIHAPSDHPLKDAPMVFRSDKHFLIERQCEHGVGHPDPDSVRYLKNTTGDEGYGVHGCDGCCAGDGGVG